MAAVLAVVDGVFTVGHHSPAGDALTRVELTDEAIRLGRLLVDLMPDEPECAGLLALMLSTAARLPGRLDGDGEVVLLADVDRSVWTHELTAEAVELLELTMRRGRVGPYQLRAAISCLPSTAVDADRTAWPQIAALYRMLETAEPSVPVRVNRAGAEAEASGPRTGLDLLDAVDGADGWHLFHAARADMLRRLDRPAEAAEAYRRALALRPNESDRRFLERRLAEVVAG